MRPLRPIASANPLRLPTALRLRSPRQSLRLRPMRPLHLRLRPRLPRQNLRRPLTALRL